MNWNEIFSPDLFLQDMFERREIYEEELKDEEYGRVVCSLCHNSVAWMYKRVLEDYPDLLDQLFLVTGSFEVSGLGVRLDHSWVEYRGDDVVMLDLTLSQFRVVDDRLYIGDRIKQLREWESVCFADYEGMKQLILSL